jgi:hypothetical protein
MGEVAVLDNPWSIFGYKAEQNSIVLVIPRDKLLVKLQQDLGMASRFYRVAVLLLSSRLQGLISRLGYGGSRYEIGSSLSAQIKYADEVEPQIMDNLTLGGARFEWMLKRLKVS